MFWCECEYRSTHQSNVVLNDLLRLLTVFLMLQGAYGEHQDMLGVYKHTLQSSYNPALATAAHSMMNNNIVSYTSQ